MKLLKLISIILALTLYNTNSFATTKSDCSLIETNTGMKIYEKVKCKMGKDKSEGFGKKFKNLFKKD